MAAPAHRAGLYVTKHVVAARVNFVLDRGRREAAGILTCFRRKAARRQVLQCDFLVPIAPSAHPPLSAEQIVQLVPTQQRGKPARWLVLGRLTSYGQRAILVHIYAAAIIALQAAAHSRQRFAHSDMCLSSGNFSQAAAHCSHAIRHALHCSTESGPRRVASAAAAEQTS